VVARGARIQSSTKKKFGFLAQGQTPEFCSPSGTILDKLIG